MATATQVVEERAAPGAPPPREKHTAAASAARHYGASDFVGAYGGEQIEFGSLAPEAKLEEPSAATSPERVIEYCADPEQAITNYRLVGVVGLCVVVVLVESVFCLMLYLRRPDRIVVDRTAGGDRVVVMNDREFGLTDSVEFAKDTPTAGDKKYLAAHYLELLYGNNPDARDKQLERAIRLMTPVNGRKFFNYLKDNRILEQQAVESWQAVWTPQTVSIDANDPFTVRAIGIQRLTRIVNGASIEETRQLNVVVKLSRDQLGRDDRNLRTGYLVDWFDWNELKSPDAVGATPKSAAVSNNAQPGT
jgi:hypothetical protein